MAVLGLHCCTLTFSSGRGQELLLLQCVGFSLQWLPLLQSTSSRHTGSSSWGTWAEQSGSWTLEHRLTDLFAPWNVESSQIRD